MRDADPVCGAWVGSMDLHGSEISRVCSRREISRVCTPGRQNFAHFPTHAKNFAPARCARARGVGGAPAVRKDEEGPVGSQVRAERVASVIGVALWGERSEPHGKFCTAVQAEIRISHVWAVFRAFDSPQKFRGVNTISRVRFPRGKISLTPHPWVQ